MILIRIVLKYSEHVVPNEKETYIKSSEKIIYRLPNILINRLLFVNIAVKMLPLLKNTFCRNIYTS